MSEAREKRAEDRRRRRGDGDEPDGDSASSGAHMQDALRAAASAAAVGAAVGAARAYSRRHHAQDEQREDEPEEQEQQDEQQDEPEQEEPRAEREQDEPEAEHEDEEPQDDQPQPERDEDPEPEPVRAGSRGELSEAVDQARSILREMRGVDAEAVSSAAPRDGGWTVGLEVVEVHRIPESTDVLATYEVELDGDGGVRRFERVRRYHRSEAARGGDG